MKTLIARSIAEAQDLFGPCALAIGNFDGVHIGHQALLRETAAFAKANNLLTAALTFHPHPTAVVAPHRLPLLLVSLEERLRLLASNGVERIFVLPFTEQVAALSPNDFVQQVLVDALTTKAVFVGETFRFGARQAGDTSLLKALAERCGCAAHFLTPVTYRGEVVSSSAIRQHLAAAQLDRANRLLGRCFTFDGPVVSGHGIGSKQTVPTLNVQPVAGQVLPRGVFVTETHDANNARCWRSITNVGNRPTFNGEEFTIETYLLEALTGPSPGQIRVEFRHFVRSEKRFPDAAALKAQIGADVGRAQAYWRRASKLALPSASIY